MILLLIAPDSNLDLFQEIITVAGSGYRVDALVGNVSARQVTDQNLTQQYTKLHFAGHGDRNVLQMSGGEVLRLNYLEQAIKAAGTVRLVILNGCKTIDSAVDIHNSGVPYVIAWSDDVDDKAAADFAISFWHDFRLSDDVVTAYNFGREAVREFHTNQKTMPILLNGQSEAFANQLLRMTKPETYWHKIWRRYWWILGIAIILDMMFHVWTLVR